MRCVDCGAPTHRQSIKPARLAGLHGATPLPWLVDSIAQHQLEDAWSMWKVRAVASSSDTQLEYGDPAKMLEAAGRPALEQALESFFSKWVWQWDVERQHAPLLRMSREPAACAGVLAQEMHSLPLYPDISQEELDPPLRWFADATSSLTGTLSDSILLRDAEVLWPRQQPEGSALSAAQRVQIIRYVLARLVSLEEARTHHESVRSPAPAKRDSPRKDVKVPRSPAGAGDETSEPPASSTLNTLGGALLPSKWPGFDRLYAGVASLGEQVTIPLWTAPADSATSSEESEVARGAYMQEAANALSDGDHLSGDASSSGDQQDSATELHAAPAEGDTAKAPSTVPQASAADGASRYFTTSAPFSALHERLSQVLGMSDEQPEQGADAEAPHQLAHGAEQVQSATAADSAQAAPRSYEQRSVAKAPEESFGAQVGGGAQADAAARADAGSRANPLTSAAGDLRVRDQHAAETLINAADAPAATSNANATRSGAAPEMQASGAKTERAQTPSHAPASEPQRRSFPSLFAAPTGWYANRKEAARPVRQEVVHDSALDGWGDEQPVPWQHARLRVGDRSIQVAFTRVRASAFVVLTASGICSLRFSFGM